MTADCWPDDVDPTRCDRHRTYDCTHPDCLPPEHAAPGSKGRDHDPHDDGVPRSRRIRRALDVLSEPPPVEIVEGIAWADSVTVLVSESGVGKTFVALDLGAAVSDGVRWHGRDVQPGSVVYIVYEGVLSRRLRALYERAGRSLEHLHILDERAPLSPRVPRDGGEQPSIGELDVVEEIETLRDELARAGQPPIVLIVIDTVRASLSGSEDSSEHVSAYLRVVGRILAQVPGAAALLVHHAGWQDGETQRKRERGSSAWRGNVDGTLYLQAGTYDPERHERRLILETRKVRDGEEPPPLHLIRRRVDLFGMDRRQQPITSCIIERDRRTREDCEAERAHAAAAAHREIDLRVLRAMRDYRTATNTRLLRAHLGGKMTIIEDAIARILQAGWATAGKRGQAYQVTPQGCQVLGMTPDTPTTPNDTPVPLRRTTPDTRPYRGGVGGGVGSPDGDRDTTPRSVVAIESGEVATHLFDPHASTPEAHAPGRPRRRRRAPRGGEARP